MVLETCNPLDNPSKITVLVNLPVKVMIREAFEPWANIYTKMNKCFYTLVTNYQ